MRDGINKEKTGKTVRFSIRLERELHEKLKKRMEESRESGRYRSMNRDIEEIVRRGLEQRL